jgi:putative Mn2+ efflux pump MntP
MLQCFSLPIGLLLLFMGLTALYSAFFNRQSLVEEHPQASPVVTAAIAVVMGSLITYIGFSLITHALVG